MFARADSNSRSVTDCTTASDTPKKSPTSPVSQVLGRRFETIAEVVELLPFGIRYRAVNGPVQWETAYRLGDEDGRTRIEIELTGEVGDFFGVSEAVVQSVTDGEREFESALANMKHILEGRGES